MNKSIFHVLLLLIYTRQMGIVRLSDKLLGIYNVIMTEVIVEGRECEEGQNPLSL